MTISSTPERILRAAENLFAEHGMDAVSLRSIIAEADVNIAAIHYHFGSKEKLIKKLLRRRIGPINKARLEGLSALRKKFGKEPIALQELFYVFLRPVIEVGSDGKDGGRDFFRCIARAHAGANPETQKALFAELEEVITEFLKELKRTAPELTDKERALRLSFVAGAMVQAVLLPLKPIFIEKLFGEPPTSEEMLDILVAFASGGFTTRREQK